MEISSLMQALSDGEFHSGSELGALLGVSRTAIWKALDRLAEYGLEYESHRGKGYRLLRPLDLLDLQRTTSALPSRAQSLVDVHNVLSCGSTNASVHDCLSGGDARYVALLSEQQTAGRGRRGRSWCSPFAENIYLSVLFDWYKGAAELQGLSIVAGVAVAELLADEGVAGVGLKWPNDVWISGKKVAGILVELEGEVTSGWRVTLGLGLNTHMSQASADDIDQPWTAVSEFVDLQRSEFAAKLIDRLVSSIEEFAAMGFSSFISRYDMFDALRGRSVDLHGPDVQGLVAGIDVNGALLLEIDSGVVAFHAGELSVRLA